MIATLISIKLQLENRENLTFTCYWNEQWSTKNYLIWMKHSNKAAHMLFVHTLTKFAFPIPATTISPLETWKSITHEIIIIKLIVMKLLYFLGLLNRHYVTYWVYTRIFLTCKKFNNEKLLSDVTLKETEKCQLPVILHVEWLRHIY